MARRLPARASTRCRRRPDAAAPTSRADQKAMLKRYVASKRHTMQVDFDDYLRRPGQGARAPARERARARGTRCRCRTASTTRRAAPSRARWPRRERSAPRSPASASAPRRPTARRSSTAAREVFADIGYGAATRARHRPRAPTWRRARSTTTSPTRSRCSARWSRRRRGRRACACAPRAAAGTTLEAFVARRLPRLLRRTCCEDRDDARSCMRRNAGTIRAMFDEPSLVAGVEELAEDLRAGDRRRADPRARRRVHGRRDGRRGRRGRRAHARGAMHRIPIGRRRSSPSCSSRGLARTAR